MSTYYSYYLGYKREDGLVYPLGPFDLNGYLHPALWKSGSFASDLKEEFYQSDEYDRLSEDFKKKIGYTDPKDREGACYAEDPARFLKAKDLPKGSYVRRGYFLIDDIKTYEQYGVEYPDNIFYDYLPESAYADRLKIEKALGYVPKMTDDAGEEYPQHSVYDYSYYAWVDKHSKEYEAEVIRRVIDTLEFTELPSGSEPDVIVVLTVD